MTGAGLSYGLNITKKQPFGSRPPPDRRKPIFDEDDDSGSEEHESSGAAIETIGEFGGIDSSLRNSSDKIIPKTSNRISVPKKGLESKKNAPLSQYGDLSSTFTSKKNANTAEELDANIYDYDAVYDSLKPQKKVTAEDKQRKPKYMTNLIAAAAVRKRDATIAEEKRLAREREAEGEEFADKEKFVTSAYKKQQEENRRLEAEEKTREEQEQKKNKGTGMTNFFKNVLERGEQKHAEIVKAAEEAAKVVPNMEQDDANIEKTEAELAAEINNQVGGAIAVNDEGQVVDKRQLLKGGLNILPKAKVASSTTSSQGHALASDRPRPSGSVGGGGGKQAMRERQSRMMEAQLEQATKRALEEEEEERARVERSAKSRKTEGEIMSAKERYLQRKREATEAKKSN